jgi:hypothetical protein
VRQLDAVVRNKFRDDPVRLAEWESARHTTRTNVPPTTPEQTPTQPAS